jgi:multiple sugar transport system ATP-binding protein
VHGASGDHEVFTGGARIPIEASFPPDTKLSLGVRPEDLHLDTGGAFQGEVQVVARLGHRSLVHFTFGEESIVAESAGDADLHVGDRVAFAADGFYLFDDTGVAIGRA